MKKVLVVFVVLFVWAIPVFAVAPVTEDMILEAQAYGRAKVELELNEFLAPWTVCAEKAEKISVSSDRILLYTPYLMLAYDACHKMRAGQPIKVTDAEKILADYAGYHVFTVTLHGESPAFAEKMTTVAKQANKTILPYGVKLMPPEAVSAAGGKKSGYSVHAYVYFIDKEIKADQPVTLTVTTTDAKVRNFHFDLPNIR